MTEDNRPTIHTIGHSNQTFEKFCKLLKAHGIQAVADVRKIPRSRHNPQFDEDNLPNSLDEAGIDYRHFERLGGLRHTTKDSVNTGWRVAGFRGYADHMQTPEFRKELTRLEQVASKKSTAVMCAEAVPWRCHRQLIADALTVGGWRVLHIQSTKSANEHEPTSFLKVEDGMLVYS